MTVVLRGIFHCVEDSTPVRSPSAPCAWMEGGGAIGEVLELLRLLELSRVK